MQRLAYLASCLVIGLSVNSCASVDAPALMAGQRPNQSTTEAGLWLASDKAEKEVKTSALRVKDTELEAYVSGLVCKMAGPYCADTRVYVMNIPYMNANMAPNGVMQVWTGLLLRAENEAQLSFVIGHEVGHYVERHSLERWRNIQNSANAAMIFGIAAGVGGVPELGTLAQVAALSNIYGFSRENEREADRLGFKRLVQAGYDGRQAANMWRAVVAEVEKSEFEKKKKKIAKAGTFDTHPVTSERISYLDELANQTKNTGEIGRDRYRAMIDPYIGSWLRSELRRKDFGESLYLIDRLIAHGSILGELYFYKGEAYRLRRKDGDQELALKAYETALDYDDMPAEVWREVGQIYWQKNELHRAQAAFQSYLEKSPQAQDRLIIEDYLQKVSM